MSCGLGCTQLESVWAICPVPRDVLDHANLASSEAASAVPFVGSGVRLHSVCDTRLHAHDGFRHLPVDARLSAVGSGIQHLAQRCRRQYANHNERPECLLARQPLVGKGEIPTRQVIHVPRVGQQSPLSQGARYGVEAYGQTIEGSLGEIS